MFYHFFLYVIAFILVFTYNVMDSGYMPFIADIIFVVISLVSFATIIILRKKVTANFETELVTASRGSVNKININIVNHSFLPLPSCRILVVLCTNNKNKRMVIKTFCEQHSTQTVSFNLPCKNCEKIVVKIKKIYLYDYLNLLCLSKKIGATSDVIVLPNLPEQDVLNKISFDMNGESDAVYSTTKAGDDPTEIFAIREYNPGDKIRNIHWKLSAKVDDIMVKDYGFPLYENDTVVIDIGKMTDDKNKLIINELYELLYGLIHSMTARGFGLTICYNNGNFVETRIEKEIDIVNLFEDVYDIAEIAGESCAELYYVTHKKCNNRVFYVTDHYNEVSENRMRLLKDTGPVYYLIPKSAGGGEYLIRFDD